MADGPRPQLASVTIRRLVLPPGESRHGLGDAIAAALARELGTDHPAAPEPGVARAIARNIAGHPELAGASRGRTQDGGR